MVPIHFQVLRQGQLALRTAIPKINKNAPPFSVLLFVLRFLNGYIRPCRYSYRPHGRVLRRDENDGK